MRRWMFQWVSGVVEPWHTEKEAQLALNQAAKQRSYDLWREHGVRVHWTRIRNGEDYTRPAPVEITDDWWPEEGG